MQPLLYDHREERSRIPRLLVREGVPVEAASLPVGDFIVSDRVVVERKTGSDLAASVKSRRLFEQVERLRDAYPVVVLVVEGEPVHMSEASWMGALARVVAAGVALVRTEDAGETADWLARLYRLERKGPSELRGRPRARRDVGDAGIAEDVLGALPGISSVGARRLLDHFGSLSAVFGAGEAELLEVRGIGPIRARTLARVFEAR
jgi:ERCC4-type nuclease